jgi:hypothetical protein
MPRTCISVPATHDGCTSTSPSAPEVGGSADMGWLGLLRERGEHALGK